ncbi:MAG: YdeI/OmpD-associated family protein [Bacteroidota bacterium]|nr:YdeI/OmpD-associated family protein [Bacteroidota bacterium]
MTPLLRIKKIDFALVFAINGNQLNGIMKDVIPILNKESKLWVAYPKTASKIASDLNRDCNWEVLSSNNFVSVCEVTLDHVWSAHRFERTEPVVEVQPELQKVAETKKVELKGVDFDKILVVAPAELEKMFKGHKKAREFFQNLSVRNQQEFVEWIEGAKRQDTRTRRLQATVEKLLAGKRSPLEK